MIVGEAIESSPRQHDGEGGGHGVKEGNKVLLDDQTKITWDSQQFLCQLVIESSRS